MLNRSGKISIIFIVVCLVCLGIWLYFKDFRTALIVFTGYAGIRIIANFIKRKSTGDYYEAY